MMHFLDWFENTSFSAMMRGSVWAEPIVETVHVLILTLFLGFVFQLDLRLLGIGMRYRRASEVLHESNPWLAGSFVVLVISGLLLFAADPVTFYNNAYFKVKMIMIVVAGLNVLLFNATAGRSMVTWDQDLKTPTRAKIAAIASLVLWISVVATGRIIAYTIPPPIK
jgi:hypothetical protein